MPPYFAKWLKLIVILLCKRLLRNKFLSPETTRFFIQPELCYNKKHGHTTNLIFKVLGINYFRGEDAEASARKIEMGSPTEAGVH